MANKNYYRYGDQELISVPVNKTMVVEIGDFIVRANSSDAGDDGDNVTEDNAIPVSAMIPDGSEGTAQQSAADQFLGIAMSQSLSGQDDPLLIATKGFFELTQASALAIEVGDQLEIAWSASNCLDQLVNEGGSAIAICVKDKTSTSLTGVLCRLIPSILMDDAPQHT